MAVEIPSRFDSELGHQFERTWSMNYDCHPKWEKLAKFVEDNPEYELSWAFRKISEGTVNSVLYESYKGISRQQERNYDPDRAIVPVLTTKKIEFIAGGR